MLQDYYQGCSKLLISLVYFQFKHSKFPNNTRPQNIQNIHTKHTYIHLSEFAKRYPLHFEVCFNSLTLGVNKTLSLQSNSNQNAQLPWAQKKVAAVEVWPLAEIQLYC